MSTSPHRASDALASEAAFDLLTDDSATSASTLFDDPVAATSPGNALFDQEAPFIEAPAGPANDAYGYPADADPDDADQLAYAEDSYERVPDRTRPRATVYASLPGMPGRGVVFVTSLAVAGTAVLDFALTGGLSYFFDLTFVVICLVAAMAVIAVLAPTTFVASGGVGQVFLTGLTAHAGALVFGYGTALVTVAGRAAHHRHR